MSKNNEGRATPEHKGLVLQISVRSFISFVCIAGRPNHDKDLMKDYERIQRFFDPKGKDYAKSKEFFGKKETIDNLNKLKEIFVLKKEEHMFSGNQYSEAIKWLDKVAKKIVHKYGSQIKLYKNNSVIHDGEFDGVFE